MPVKLYIRDLLFVIPITLHIANLMLANRKYTWMRIYYHLKFINYNVITKRWKDGKVSFATARFQNIYLFFVHLTFTCIPSIL